MGKLFIITQEEVKYPTFCPQGIFVKEIEGRRQFPVEEFLGRELISKIGEQVEENVDFEVMHRVISNGNTSQKAAFLCDKGEIIGGGMKKLGSDQYSYGDWRYDILGDKKKYLAHELIPIQHAQKVETPKYLENIKWKKIQKEFEQKFTHISTPTSICEWFRKKLEYENETRLD